MRSRSSVPAGVAIALLLLPAGGASSSPASLPALAQRIESLLRSPVLRPQETGLIVVVLPEGRVLYEKNADRPLKPASTLKIVTSAAALSLLGPEFSFETILYADAPPDAAGHVTGDLYVRGSGAPDLVSEAWWLIARRLAAVGIRRVRGDLVGDETFFDAVRRPPGWPPATDDSAYNAPIGALSCNFNAVAVTVVPAARLEDSPRVFLEPASSYFGVVQRAVTTERPTSLSVSRVVRDGRNTVILGGQVRRSDAPLTFYRSVDEPALYALHAFRDIARAEGIIVDGTARVGPVPENAVEIHRHVSRPLGILVRDMNKHSNNFMAESLVKTLGATLSGRPGTTEIGLRVIEDYLVGIGLDPDGATLADGSGLSKMNRVPPRLVAGVLAAAAGDFSIGPDLAASFPIGGADGTLQDRFAGDPLKRRVRAKTGRVFGARALAGYVENASGRRFAFALLADRPRGSSAAVEHALDRIVAAIADSTDDEIVPLLETPMGGGP